MLYLKDDIDICCQNLEFGGKIFHIHRVRGSG